MSNKEYIFIDGTKFQSEEELKKRNEEFWQNAFIESASELEKRYWSAQFRNHYENLKVQQEPPFSEWYKISRTFQSYLDQQLLNSDFIPIFIKILVLFPPRCEILNELFQFELISNELKEKFRLLQESDSQGRK